MATSKPAAKKVAAKRAVAKAASRKGKAAVSAKGGKPVGRPPNPYDPVVGDVICERIAAGESLRGICKDADMPAASTVFRWLTESQAFQEQYARAREEQAETLADEIVAIADESAVIVKHEGEDVQLSFDPTAIARNRLRVDARKWVASKLKPKKYGDKVTQEHTGVDGGPVQTVTTFKLADLE